MLLNDRYILQSERLGFRNWSENDLTEFAELNADPEVMKYFPKRLTKEETALFIGRLQKHYSMKGHTYFAVELLSTKEFIGFIGLVYQEYEAVFTPATDIGWRLKKSAWSKGYATEGAKRCLEFAFDDLKLDRVVATCALQNAKSENVMQKIGMLKKGEFSHPKLAGYPGFETSLWYEIKSKQGNL